MGWSVVVAAEYLKGVWPPLGVRPRLVRPQTPRILSKPRRGLRATPKRPLRDVDVEVGAHPRIHPTSGLPRMCP
ncbi:hypothetical protein HCTV-15_gp103 [Haloarcula virus HCTV-15]|nr:hypothetical protein HRTV-2_gp106 [Halorubrum virus HRTV-2]UBF22470.1 hypothetical protein HCTV-6_gp103 [Haloarcula virus HCTV-6]UBF22577.1 hypothetical protein HCTV-15_gp103 [Haloarcula virus HCTV-15]